jgi:hypothetical protein
MPGSSHNVTCDDAGMFQSAIAFNASASPGCSEGIRTWRFVPAGTDHT